MRQRGRRFLFLQGIASTPFVPQYGQNGLRIPCRLLPSVLGIVPHHENCPLDSFIKRAIRHLLELIDTIGQVRNEQRNELQILRSALVCPVRVIRLANGNRLPLPGAEVNSPQVPFPLVGTCLDALQPSGFLVCRFCHRVVRDGIDSIRPCGSGRRNSILPLLRD